MGIFGWNLVGTRIGSILCHFYHFLFQIPPQKFCIKFWKKSQNRPPPRRSNAPQMTKNEENAWYGPKKCPHQISFKNSQYFFLFRFFEFSRGWWNLVVFFQVGLTEPLEKLTSENFQKNQGGGTAHLNVFWKKKC